MGPGLPSVPALLTATSKRPNRATVLSTKVRTSSSWRTSDLTNSASAPSMPSSPTSFCPSSSCRPEITMRAPSRAKASAVARPIPVSAPVIKTTGVVISVLLEGPCAYKLVAGIPTGTSLLFCSCSAHEEQSRVFNEQLRVLVVRAVIGVGVDDQLSIRDVLLHDERTHRRYVHVVTAVHDECWLLDRLQIVGGPLLLDAPLANRFDLGGRHLVVHFGVAALLPTMRALQELPSRRLARRRRTEFDREPDTLGRIVGVGTKEPPCSLGDQLHSLTAARTCAIDDQPANEIGRLQSDFLHDHAADREAK